LSAPFLRWHRPTIILAISTTNTVESETPKPEPKEEKQVTTYYRGSYTPINVMAPELPKSFTLFGERMPLEIWDVRERFDRELLVNTYMQGKHLLYH
jgi:hypothetical protein